jgi:hypothetical protein
MRQVQRPILTLLLGLVTAAAWCAAAAAVPQVSALSSVGDLYQVRVGTVGSLFANAPAALRENQALALEIRRAGEDPELLLVPHTEGAEVENAPFLLVEGRSNGVHLVWESRRNFIYSRINLASYIDGRWSEVVELSGEFFSQKSAPRIAVTRDSYQEFDAETGVLVTYHLTNFHTVWFEDASNGRQAVYSLVQFRNGVFQHPNQVFVLGELDGTEGPALAAPAGRLLEAPTVVAGRDDEHAVAAFADLASGRLSTVDLAVVPHTIVALAEKVRADITDIGVRNKQALAQAIALLVQSEGGQIHPDFRSYLAQAAYGAVLEAPDSLTAVALANKIRADITDIGARLTVMGKSDFTQPMETVTVEIPAAEAAGLPTILLARVGSSRPAPEVGNTAVTLYPSPNGSDVLVAWETPTALNYVESDGDGWSQLRSLPLGDDLDLDDAHQLLEHRSRSR